jgi:acyl-CoA synthetase (NDP forming)
VASLSRVFRPDSVAVVGASRRTGTVGRSILHNIVTGSYHGRIYAINPHAFRMEGLRCLPSVTALPEPADLAVLAVPPAAVPLVADQCGRRGIGALVVVTAGLDALPEADLLATCRRYGMRLVGPNCLGVAVPGIGLDATFAARHPAAGMVGLVTQSSGLGLALADRLSRLGLGISSFASVGDRLDVSSNDMLAWWEKDDTTRLAVLCVESFGNPRTFVAAARRIGAVMPVLAAQASLAGRESLFEQTGVIATDGPGDVLATAALLASQPVPAGRGVAVISNVGTAAALAAGACSGHGLLVPTLSPQTRRRLHAFVPPGGAVTGPVDTTAVVAERSFRRCVELVAADEGVDAVLALVLPTAATGDLVTAVCTADVSVPLAAVILDQAEPVRLLAGADDREPPHDPGPPGSVPAYSDPEAAARALAHAASYGAWRARRAGRPPGLGGVRAADARKLVRAFLADSPHGGWLTSEQVAGLLGCYGVRLASREPAGRDGNRGGRDANRGGHGGTGFVVGIGQDPAFGPLITLGHGRTGPGEPGDHATRLAPLTDADADDLMCAIRSVPELAGRQDEPAVGRAALRQTLLCVSRLADDIPEVADLSLGPVIARAEAASAERAQIRLAPVLPYDPFRRNCHRAEP